MRTWQSDALDELYANGTAQYGPALRQWKEEGGKVIGVLYAYIPDEIIAAAGLLPYRMRAFDSTSNALANPRFNDICCTLVRHFYDEAKRGGFHFCDGLVSANACDHERRLFENLCATTEVPFSSFANLPKKAGDAQVDYYARSLRAMIADLEEAFGVEVTEESLRGAIAEYNRARALQRELYAMRKKENPPLTGADMLAIMLAQGSMPIDRYLALLEQVVAEAKEAPGIDGYTMRAVVYGGEIDSVPLIETIESQGALVVGDYLGFGWRACAVDVPDTGDAVRDLAYNIIMDRPDSRQFGSVNARQDRVASIVQAWDADGVIVPAITFCDYWTWEQFNFGAYCKEHGIPLLNLDIEYLFSGSGQMKTRVQAFAEANGRS